MRWRRALAAAAVLVVAAGCSGDDAGESTTTTTQPPASTTVETTAPPAATPPSTDAPTTAPTSTADPVASTSEPASTTIEPGDGTLQMIAVVEAVEASWEASLAAVRDPFSDEKIAQLEEHFAGVLLDGWRNIVADYRSSNYREIENPTEPDAFEVELASIAVNNDGTLASVQGCSITSGIIVEVGGNPDGSDRVIEDGVAKTVLEFDVVRVAGVWKVEDAREPDEQDRIASCD